MKYEKYEAGEIWIQFETIDEFKENREEIIDKYLERSYENKKKNTCRLVIYIKSTASLCKSRLCTYASFEKLRDRYGADNVKFVPTEPVTVPFREFTKGENIERIADALEGIQHALDRLSIWFTGLPLEYMNPGKAIGDPAGNENDTGAKRDGNSETEE